MAKVDLQKLQERLSLAKRGRQPYEADWFLNIAYLSGEHYVTTTLDTATRVVELEQNGPMPVHNVLQKVARTERTKLLKTQPIPVALPITDDDGDVYAAKIITAYFRYLQDEFKYERKLRQAAYWLVATGNVFFKWYWANGSPRMAVISPFDFYPDPYARTFDACRWGIYQQFMDEDSARELYGLKDEKLNAVKSSSNFDLNPIESRLYSNYGATGGSLPGVLINEYWEPPSPTCPKGRFVVFADNEILHEQDFPYAHGKLPFTHAAHIERSNSKWSASVLDQVRFMQDELNRVERQLIENRNISNGIWFIPAQVTLEQEITSEPRQVIKWDGPPNLDPRSWFVQPQGMANWVSGEPDRIKSTIQDLVHQHEVSNAGVPGRVESGQAIQLLQETDDSVMKETIHSFEEAVADGFLQCATLYKQYAPDDPLMIRVYDKNGAVQVREFTKDIVPVDLRVRTQTTTGLPNTIAGKWDRVLNLVQYQLIDPNYALELLDISPEDPELKPDTLDVRNADSENRALLDGEPILAQKSDNHIVHRERHMRFQKTAEYKMAVAEDPTIAEKFEAHLLSHLDEYQKWAQEEVMIQQMMNPAPPEGGGEGAPPGSPQPPEPPAPAPNGGPAPVA